MRLSLFHITRQKILKFLLVVVFVLFFAGGPDYQSARHYIAIWNLGHILFFALLSYQLFSCRNWLSRRFSVQCLLTLGISLTLGVFVEFFQYGFHRTPDAGDVVRDVIGGLVGVFFLLGSRKTLRTKVLVVFQMITICLVGLQIYPVFAALTDECLAREQFPVLSSFETPWEIARWRGSAAFSIDGSIHVDGNSSLRVQLRTGRHSGVRLKYFPGNWEGAKGFRFSVYNPSAQALSIICWIQDQHYEKGRTQYTDRFNRLYELPPGWTTIDIDIQVLHSALNGRRMDLGHIEGVGFFTRDLPRPRVVYIDDVRLVY